MRRLFPALVFYEIAPQDLAQQAADVFLFPLPTSERCARRQGLKGTGLGPQIAAKSMQRGFRLRENFTPKTRSQLAVFSSFPDLAGRQNDPGRNEAC
jgi:hypothetical protein